MTEIKFNKENFIFSEKGSYTKKYERGELIGKGGFGSVFIVKNKTTNVELACKKIAKYKIESKEDLQTLYKEISLLSKLDHPNISKIYEAYEDEDAVYIIMEYCKGGELYKKIIELLNKGELLTEEAIAQIFHQIMSVIAYCHNHGICHRDIKPENVLFIEKNNDKFENNIKIIDFGLSVYFKGGENKKMKSSVGTIYYAAPEVIDGNYNEKCDIWSCGILLYTLLIGNLPFDGRNQKDIAKKIKQMNVPYTEDFNYISKEAKDLIQKMLCKESDRISAQEVLNHPWFNVTLEKKNENKFLNLKIDNFINYVNKNKFQKMIIMYIASRLTHEEIQNMKKIFKDFDSDNNGSISLDEFKDGLLKLNNENKDKIDINKIFNEIDTDKNGEISYTELLASILDQNKLFQKKKLYDAFIALDKDGTGKINKGDLIKILKEEEKSSDSIIQLINQLDKDKDGGIDFREFLSLMEFKEEK